MIQRPPVVTVVARGEIDMVTAPGLTAAIEEAERERPDELQVDLGEVAFIDSSGLRVLLDAARRAEASGHRLRICRPNAMVRRLLAVTAIDRSLEVSPVRPE